MCVCVCVCVRERERERERELDGVTVFYLSVIVDNSVYERATRQYPLLRRNEDVGKSLDFNVPPNA